MAKWRLAKSLDVLSDEIRAYRPGTTVWTIGDEDHQDGWSDHNPNAAGVVCAIDVLADAGLDLADFADRVVASRHRALKYVIWNRRIYNPAYPGWRTYTGSNPHSTHVHVSVGQGPDGRSTGPYDDTTPWNLWEDEMTQFVRELQDTLRAAKFDPGVTDGKLGPKTLTAWSAHIAHATNSFQWKQPDGRMGLTLYSYARDATGAATQARDEVRALRELVVDAPDEPAPPPIEPIDYDALAAALLRQIATVAPPAPGSAS